VGGMICTYGAGAVVADGAVGVVLLVVSGAV